MTDAKKLTDQFWALFEIGKLEELMELVDPDVQFQMPGIDLRGREALEQMLAAYRTGFPDMRHEVRAHVEAGDTIAIELEIEATHTGPMHTPQGTIPATGKKVSWRSCDYIRVKNGRFISWHAYYDSVPFLTALGLLPTR